MYHKYFAWSIDDGLEQDKKIIEILKQFEMGATFNLNSELFGEKNYIQYIGNIGFREISAAKYKKNGIHLLHHARHFRIPEDEILQVYEGYELAAHGSTHKNLVHCTKEEREYEIFHDVQRLSEMSGKKITGFAFPYGSGQKESEELLKQAGVKHARLVSGNQDFVFPENPLAMPISCWHTAKNKYEILNQFFHAKAQEEDRFFLMFAHGYEFDFGTKESCWDELKRICEMVKEQGDIVCCSVQEAFERHENHE